MDMLTLIIALSAVMWYVIDRFKGLWAEKTYGKYITMLLAAIFAFGIVFSFELDFIYAIGLVEAVSVAGKIITSLVLMSGSSAIAEIISKVKGNSSGEV